MICKSYLRLFGRNRGINTYKLLRPQVLSTPLRSFSEGNGPRGSKYTENQDNHTQRKEFSEDKRHLEDESLRSEHKSTSFKPEGKLEREMYEELHNDTREDQSTGSQNDTNYQNNTSEHPGSRFRSSKSTHTSTSNPNSQNRKPSLHRLLYLAGFVLALYEITRIKQLSNLYFIISDWIKTRPFKIHDILINLDRKNRKLVSHIVVDDSLQTQEINVSEDLKELVGKLQNSVKDLHLSLLSLGVIGVYTSALALQVRH